MELRNLNCNYLHGSIIKSITLNFDQKDVVKYDKAVSLLTNNQNNLKNIIKDQVNLVEYSVTKFQND